MGTAWLTAYRMLFTKSGLRPGQTMLVQGASGGVSTALVQLGRAAGMRVWVTGRTEEKRALADELGAHAAFESGARLPERVDGVFETVGKATWSHSMRARSSRAGSIVVSGATSGPDPGADLQRLFFLQLRVIGSTMGTRDELADLLTFCEQSGIRPEIGLELPMEQAEEGLRAMLDGGAPLGGPRLCRRCLHRRQGLRPLLQRHRVNRNGRDSCRAARSRPCPPRESGTAFAFDAQDADQLATIQQRHPELAVGMGQAGQRDAPILRAESLLGRTPVDRVGIQHLADQPGDPDRLARLRDDAGDPFAETDLGTDAGVGIAAARDGDEHPLFRRGDEDHRMVEAKALFDRFEDRIEQLLE